MKRSWWIGLILCFAFAIAGWKTLDALSHKLYQIAFVRCADKKLAALKGINGAAAPWSQLDRSWIASIPSEEWKLTTHDNLRLVARFVPQTGSSKYLVICAHGYRGHNTEVSPIAQHYYEKYGCHVLLPNARAHGESEGDQINFGWLDRLDWLNWIAMAQERLGEDLVVILHGISMGGATVLMIAGENPPCVKAVVSDCAYTGLQEILTYQLSEQFHIPSFPLVGQVDKLLYRRQDFHMEEASARQQLLKSELPVLFIHGAKDDFVPFSMVDELFEACHHPEKRKLVIPDASHACAWPIGREAYEEALGSFLQPYLQAQLTETSPTPATQSSEDPVDVTEAFA